MVYLNGERILSHNLRDRESWNGRARSHRNTEALLFEDFDLSEYSRLLKPGENLLAIRGINASSNSSDMLILPALVSRVTDFGPNPNALVYYTTDRTDPRGTDGLPTATAIALRPGASIRITRNETILARTFDDSFRGLEARIVGTDWGGLTEYRVSVDRQRGRFRPQFRDQRRGCKPVVCTSAFRRTRIVIST